uniref:G-protein coupled receptors family 3 profile domain-containing protein n=1 Tax=Astyanax mexicanus TaxID=7994 RepID=A0A8B9GT73_ASTMX
LKTMIYTVEEINRDLNLLPNLTLGYMIADSCLSEGSALSAALSLVTGNVKVVSGEECTRAPTVPVIIGDILSSSSIVLAIVIARLLNRMGWSWVGVIYGDDAYGQTSAQLLINEVQGSNVCMAYSEVIPKSYSQSRITQIVEKIQSSKAQVVVIFAISADTEVLIKEAVKRNVTDKQWIAPTSWSTAADFTAWCGISLVGTIGIALRSVEIQGLSSYLTNLSTEHYPTEKLEQNVWEEAFGCKFPTDSQSGLLKPKCSNLGNIQVQTAGFDGMYNVYKAVYAVAHAIQNMQDCEPGKGPFKNGNCPEIKPIIPEQGLIKTFNWTSRMWSGEEVIKVETSLIAVQVPVSVCSESCPPGTRKAVQKGKPICCFDCIHCAAGEISNTTDSTECMKCPQRFWSNTDRTQCIPMAVEFLSFQDDMGIILAALSYCKTTKINCCTYYICLWVKFWELSIIC